MKPKPKTKAPRFRSAKIDANTYDLIRSMRAQWVTRAPPGVVLVSVSGIIRVAVRELSQRLRKRRKAKGKQQ